MTRERRGQTPSDESHESGSGDPFRGEEITSLHLFLTTACSLRCSYCCQRRDRPRRMPWETLRRAVDWCIRPGRPDLKLVFSGGEPLLALPLIRRAVTYARLQSGRRWPLKYLLLTNGLHLDETALDFLIDNRFEVQLSFDGVPAAQDLRSRGSFPKLDRLLDRIRYDHPSFHRRRLSVAVTVVPRTVRHMADSFAYFLSKGIAEVAIAPTLAASSGWNSGRIVELESQFDQLHLMSVEHHRRTGRIPLLDFRGGPIPTRPPWPSRTMCGVMRGETPALDVDGEVYGCSMLVGSELIGKNRWLGKELRELRIGNLLDPLLPHRFTEFCRSAETRRFLIRKERKRSSYGRCGSCPAIEACALCPVSIGLQPGNTDPDRIPDFNCAFARVMWNARERFIREAGGN